MPKPNGRRIGERGWCEVRGWTPSSVVRRECVVVVAGESVSPQIEGRIALIVIRERDSGSVSDPIASGRAT